MDKKLILFQGDSITDAMRERNGDNYLGNGYPTFISGRLGLDNPQKYSFMNRGISGNRVVDLYARWKCDCINLKPDVLSILIGVNDVWHEVDFHNGVEEEKFEMVYGLIIEEALRKLPNVKIMILEPFIMDGTALGANRDYMFSEVFARARAAKRVAEKYSACFVPLQSLLDEATALMPANQLTIDGVHPTAIGHQLIADAWIKKFYELNV